MVPGPNFAPVGCFHFAIRFQENGPDLRRGLAVRPGFGDRLTHHFDSLLHQFPVVLHPATPTAAAIIRSNSASTFALKSASIWYTSVNSANAQRPYVFRLFTPGTQYTSIVDFFSFASSPR